MPNSRTNHLKLYTEQVPSSVSPDVPLRSLPAVLDSFRQATGWSLQYCPEPPPDRLTPDSVPVQGATGAASGQLVLSPSTGQSAIADLNKVRPLTESLGRMVGEMLHLQEALWQREAELAAGVPLVLPRDEQQHLAQRLEAVLKGGAEAVGCQAAGLYLLDEATSELKLRSCWGLPRRRLLDPARPLRGAMADLEAMLGHAVVLDEALLMEHWAAPESFPAAVCIPVATATTILGTLWVFATERRTFDDRQTNILEVVAGRLAADLEREMLLREGIEGARLKRQLGAAQRLQQDQIPQVAPEIDGWDIWGWSSTSQSVGGQFYDWFSLSNGSVVAMLGSATGRPIEAAIAAAAIRSTLRTHGQYHFQPELVLTHANQTLWTMSAGGQHASACYAVCRPGCGQVLLSTAGTGSLFLLGAKGGEDVGWESSRLGENPDFIPQQRSLDLGPGQTLVGINLEAPSRDSVGRSILDVTKFSENLPPSTEWNARDLTSLLSDHLLSAAPCAEEFACTVMVAKHLCPLRSLGTG